MLHFHCNLLVCQKLKLKIDKSVTSVSSNYEEKFEILILTNYRFSEEIHSYKLIYI
jgi:hypothetical protein